MHCTLRAPELSATASMVASESLPQPIFQSVTDGTRGKCYLAFSSILHQTPALHLRQRTGLHDGNGVADASLVVLVMRVELLLVVVIIFLVPDAACARQHDDGLVVNGAHHDALADLARIRSSLMLSNLPLCAQLTGAHLGLDASDVLLDLLHACGVVKLGSLPSGNAG